MGDRSVAHARDHRELRTQGAAEDTSADRLQMQIGTDRAGSEPIGCNAMASRYEAASPPSTLTQLYALLYHSDMLLICVSLFSSLSRFVIFRDTKQLGRSDGAR